MKLKCGKCGNIIDTETDKIVPLDDLHIGIICNSCNSTNKLAKSSLQTIKKDEQTLPLDAKKYVVNRDITGDPITFKQYNENKKSEASIPGWCFVHDENTAMQSFDFKIGRNILGRKSSKPIDIAIETNDIYMSREHCVIEVRLNKLDKYDFLIRDNKSTNGTIINGIQRKKLSTEDVFFLKDGDSLQLGMTKVVLRCNQNHVNKEQAQSEVKDSPYQATVLVSKMK